MSHRGDRLRGFAPAAHPGRRQPMSAAAGGVSAMRRVTPQPAERRGTPAQQEAGWKKNEGWGPVPELCAGEQLPSRLKRKRLIRAALRAEPAPNPLEVRLDALARLTELGFRGH